MHPVLGSAKKTMSCSCISPRKSSGSSHFRLQGPLPHASRHRLGGLDFERGGTCGHHTHPDSPERGPPSRTEGKREGIGTEGEQWAMTSLTLKP